MRFPKVPLLINVVCCLLSNQFNDLIHVLCQNGYGALELFLERYKCFGAAQLGAEFLMDYLKQMRIVARKYLGKYIVCACGEVAVNHFGYFFQTIHHFVKLGGIIQNEPYIGACLISYSGRVNYGFKPFYNA